MEKTTAAIPKELGDWLLKEAARRTVQTGQRVTMVDLATEAIDAYRKATEQPTPANEPAEEPAA